MALPVFDAQNEVVGALLISGPSSRFTAEVAKSVGDFFFKIADDLTKSLGGKSIRN
ncbi:bacterial transcriptional regulator family protein [Acinetobacter baumannii 23671]|nr:bacterial transcriptional regulator family protein [Acinetobacter baumannii 34654]EXH76326.1 bacterial transcriptional regulator family protein [Acinetobacter baumannii 23671]